MPAYFPRLRQGDRFGYRNSAGQLVLDARAARILSDIAEELRRLGKISATPPLQWADDRSGRRLSLALGQRINAKLSGAGAPYSFTEQEFTPGVGWADKAGGRTGSNAFEFNGVTGLSGQVTELEYFEVAGDWRFQFVRQMCKWTFVVHGPAGNALNGAVVTISQGGGPTLATCTTSGAGASAGTCSFSIAAGTYDVVVTPPALSGLATYTASIAHTCGQTTTITFSTDGSHVYLPSGCGPCGNSSMVYPTVIALTGGYHSGNAPYGFDVPNDTLTYSAVDGIWHGAATVTDHFPGSIPPGLAPDYDCTGKLRATCGGGGTFGLGLVYDDPTCSGFPSTGLGPSRGTAGSPPDTCNPFHCTGLAANPWVMDG